jgi:hypothetical protein
MENTNRKAEKSGMTAGRVTRKKKRGKTAKKERLLPAGEDGPINGRRAGCRSRPFAGSIPVKSDCRWRR